MSFAGGTRYSFYKRLIATASNLTYDGCTLVPITPSPTTIPTLSAGCDDPVGNHYLTGSIDDNMASLPFGYIRGTINNNTKTCTYDVGLASYKANGTNIDIQNINDYQTTSIGPGQTVILYAKSPMNNDAPSCHINPPTTPTTTPINTITPTQPSNACEVNFNIPDTAVCWPDFISSVPVDGTIVSLPEGDYYLQKAWTVIVQPTDKSIDYGAICEGLKTDSNRVYWSGETCYTTDYSTPLKVGDKFTVSVPWPGIKPTDSSVETHVGVNIVDVNGNPISPNCTAGQDYYTPYGCIDSIFTTPSQEPNTPTPTSNDQSNNLQSSATATPTGNDCPRKKEGDANCDGSVDLIDYSIWLNSQCNKAASGSNCGNTRADFNGDGSVDDSDLAIWKSNT